MNLSDASILNKLAPFFSIIFSIFLLKEKAGWRDWAVVIVAFIGALFVVKPTGFTVSFAAALGLLGGVMAGLAYTLVRLLGRYGERKSMIVFFFSACSCLASLPFMIYYFQPMSALQLLWLVLAGCAAAGAQFSVTGAYQCAPAREISVYDYSQVIFTTLWGAIFFSEFPDKKSIIGYVIIIGAAVVKYLYGRKPPKTELDNTETIADTTAEQALETTSETEGGES
jgi:drug/metabolite transporter (DMT)-like permease